MDTLECICLGRWVFKAEKNTVLISTNQKKNLPRHTGCGRVKFVVFVFELVSISVGSASFRNS